jgi:hypothetical protein
MSTKSGHRELYVWGSVRQTFPSHRLDDGPILPEEISGVVIIGCIYLNAAGLPAVPVRNLKMKNEADRLLVFLLVIAAHSVSPLFCVELGHIRFANWPFVRRECGARKHTDGMGVSQ